MSEMTSIQKDKLMNDLKLVMADAEALLAATADDANGGIAEHNFVCGNPSTLFTFNQGL